METTALMAVSPLDGRYQQKVSELSPIVSEFGLMRFRVIVEVRWLQTLASLHLKELPKLSKQDAKRLDNLIDRFSMQDAARIKHIESSINHDVKAVEYFIKEQLSRHKSLSALSEFVHFGCTSEDINNLAYGLMLDTLRHQCLLPILDALIRQLKSFAHDHAGLAMLARTHGQPATPTTLGKEFANTAARLLRQYEQLKDLPILGKMNGASGNYNALAVTYPKTNWEQVSKKFITKLGLTWNPYTTQIEPHDTLAECFAIMTRINTILLDFNRDIWGYIAINYLSQKMLANEVGSSTMPHKINPIDFENSEGNLGIANALFEHMSTKLPVSRWQRDLSDSTVLRNIGVAFGHALLAYQSTSQGITKLAPNKTAMAADLDSHWEILAEPIQTVMRRYQLEQPYEKLKTLTRGRKIDKIAIQEFIKQLALPKEAKKELLALTPASYLGYAKNLAKKI